MKYSLVVAAVVFAAAAAAQTVNIQLDNGAFIAHFPRTATPPVDFHVYAGEGDVPPMLGAYQAQGSEIIFRPQFPLTPGTRYRAVFKDASGSPVERVFEIERPQASSSTRIDHVYPSANVLPGNQLKLYISFSAPMSRGEAYQHIHLLDEAGQTVPLAFVEIDQELWDPNYQRLTVLFDPGRIKRGLVPQQELGTPIVEGKQYTLFIDRDWPDAHGAPLAAEYRKNFRGGSIDRTPPDPKDWRVTAPKSGSLDAVIIDFNKPMDYALLNRLIDVPGVAGTINVARDETEWRFTPDHAWKPGEYRIVVDTALEDLAGNHVGRAFDVDTYQPASPLASEKTVALPFVVK